MMTDFPEQTRDVLREFHTWDVARAYNTSNIPGNLEGLAYAHIKHLKWRGGIVLRSNKKGYGALKFTEEALRIIEELKKNP